MVRAKKYVVAKIFEGEIKESDLKIEEEELPELQDDEFLIEALYLSVDPYMRAYSRNFKTGQDMIGGQVAKVIESKNPKYPVGSIVASNAGWRTHTIVKGNEAQALTYILPNLGDLPVSLGLGVLGMPGNTAYFGFLDICKPKPGETVVVSGAAGAVGSHVGQLAKIKGCKVVGIAGSEEKNRWLKTLGFDNVINYKTENVEQALKKAAPNGVDCYFDNVGGEISSTVIYQMNPLGRISVCGSVSAYNDTELPKAGIVQPAMVFKMLEMKGFIVTQFQDRWMEGIQQNLKWIKEGKLRYRETVTEGFENMTRALIGVLRGENTGKAVVRVTSTNVDAYSVNFKSLLSTFQQTVAKH